MRTSSSNACRPLSVTGTASAVPRSGGKRYDVFISHRGEIKHSFVSFLRAALERAGAYVFLDEASLEPGDAAWDTMKEAARHCHVGLPVITASYGTSEWCLNELSIMMEASDTGSVDVMPVFLDDGGVGVLGKVKDALVESESSRNSAVAGRCREGRGNHRLASRPNRRVRMFR